MKGGNLRWNLACMMTNIRLNRALTLSRDYVYIAATGEQKALSLSTRLVCGDTPEKTSTSF